MKTQTQTKRYVVQVETFDMGAWHDAYITRREAASEADAMAQIPTTQSKRPAWAVDENEWH